MLKLNAFDTPSLVQSGKEFFRHLALGRVWARGAEVPDENGENGSVMGALVKASAAPHRRFRQSLDEVIKEININTTDKLLPDWETSVGLPDGCLNRELTLDERRAKVKQRLAKVPVRTIEEVSDFLQEAYPDLAFRLIPGADFYSPGFFPGIHEKFILVVQTAPNEPFFEYDWEVSFTSVDSSAISCILRPVVPANVLLSFEVAFIYPLGAALIQEEGGFILQEDGGKLLL